MTNATTDIQPLYLTVQQVAILLGVSHDSVTRKFTSPEWLSRIDAALPSGHLPVVANHAEPGDRPTADVRIGQGRKRRSITRRTRTKLLILRDGVEAYLRLVAFTPIPVQTQDATAGAA